VAPHSQVNARLPLSLDPVVMKALAREVDHRFQEAIQLQMALEKWLLEEQLPSSTAVLAAFMKDLYADRLARERQQGQVLIEQVLIEDLDASKEAGADDSPRSGKQAVPLSASFRSVGSKRVVKSTPPPADPPKKQDIELTQAERPAAKSQSNSAKAVRARLAALDAD